MIDYKTFLKRIILQEGYLLHRNRDSKIIYYHDVGHRYTDMGTEMKLIRQHFEVVRSQGFVFVDEIAQNKNQIMVCFDDGWAGLYEAKDFFIKERVFPTVFIAVDLIGKPGYLTLTQILELQDIGFHFEGHTWSHEDLTTFDDAGLIHELRDSREELSRLLKKEVKALCFPKGRFSDKVCKIADDSGYEKLYSSISGGYYDLIESKRLICRNLVQTLNPWEFKRRIMSTSELLVRRNIQQHYQR